jgi:hypothetical protein
MFLNKFTKSLSMSKNIIKIINENFSYSTIYHSKNINYECMQCPNKNSNSCCKNYQYDCFDYTEIMMMQDVYNDIYIGDIFGQENSTIETNVPKNIKFNKNKNNDDNNDDKDVG